MLMLISVSCMSQSVQIPLHAQTMLAAPATREEVKISPTDVIRKGFKVRVETPKGLHDDYENKWVIKMSENFDLIGEIALKIAEIIEKHNAVDWQTNTAIHNKIAQDIDDLFYLYEKEGKLKLDFETIDKIIENVKSVALRRF